MSHEDVTRLLSLGRVELAAGRWLAAKGFLAEALKQAEAEFGAESEEIIEPLMDLGKAVRSESKSAEALDEALRLQTRALGVAEKRIGESDPRLPAILTRVAMTCEELHALDKAVEHLARALRLLRERGEDVSFVLVNLIHVFLGAGRGTDALPYAEEALALAERTGTEGELVGPLVDLGLALRDVGQLEDALKAFTRAHSIALARPDVPELREVRKEAEAEISSWIEELNRSLGKRS